MGARVSADPKMGRARALPWNTAPKSFSAHRSSGVSSYMSISSRITPRSVSTASWAKEE